MINQENIHEWHVYTIVRGLRVFFRAPVAENTKICTDSLLHMCPIISNIDKYI